MPVIDPQRLFEERVEAVRNFHRNQGVARAQLDVSGGIDSAVMAGILVMALGKEKVTLSHTIIDTNAAQTVQAKNLAMTLDCPLIVGNFSDAYRTILEELMKSLIEAGFDGDEIRKRMRGDPMVEGSIRSTLRAPLGRGYNRLTGGGIRHGTGNECEDRFLRFYQKGGDGEVDTNPIAMLSKTEVYQLAWSMAETLGAQDGYHPIIEAKPTPDLWATGDDHNDEDELKVWTGVGFTYGRVDTKTGSIRHFGTIEMVSRFIDEYPDTYLFDDDLDNASLEALIKTARSKKDLHFPNVSEDEIEKLLIAARKYEKRTRHKMNPNIPTLGSRKALVEKGILSNSLS